MTEASTAERLAILITASPEATRAAGMALAAAIRPGQVIALRGNLGAGKTTFVQGLAAGLGVKGDVTSPTFILVNEYRTSRGTRLIHIDTYRLGDGDEATLLEASALGLEEILDTPDAVVAVEWAERIATLLPADHLQVALESTDAGNRRTISFHAHGPDSTAALTALVQQDASRYTSAMPAA